MEHLSRERIGCADGVAGGKYVGYWCGCLGEGLGLFLAAIPAHAEPWCSICARRAALESSSTEQLGASEGGSEAAWPEGAGEAVAGWADGAGGGGSAAVAAGPSSEGKSSMWDELVARARGGFPAASASSSRLEGAAAGGSAAGESSAPASSTPSPPLEPAQQQQQQQQLLQPGEWAPHAAGGTWEAAAREAHSGSLVLPGPTAMPVPGASVAHAGPTYSAPSAVPPEPAGAAQQSQFQDGFQAGIAAALAHMGLPPQGAAAALDRAPSYPAPALGAALPQLPPAPPLPAAGWAQASSGAAAAAAPSGVDWGSLLEGPASEAGWGGSAAVPTSQPLHGAQQQGQQGQQQQYASQPALEEQQELDGLLALLCSS